MIRVSIILPTYNVELYIERCVRSLENQDLDPTSYEIIVVDDGATDRSVDKVVALQEEFHNIVLVRQPNAGLSAARNTGIRQAKGAYLLFVDSDDAVEANCLSAMLAIADRNPDADLFGFNYRIHLNSGLVVLPKWPATDGRPMSGTRYFETYVAGDYHAVRFLYVRQFLLEHGLSFLEGISFEDVEFIPRLLFHAERVVFNDLPFYLYYLRPHSISTSNLAIHISSRIAAAENLHRFLKAQGGARRRKRTPWSTKSSLSACWLRSARRIVFHPDCRTSLGASAAMSSSRSTRLAAGGTRGRRRCSIVPWPCIGFIPS
jgi:glycosyltransferase involved in cell wall biosynthesis